MAGFNIARDYLTRHKNNVNRALHIIGIPLVIAGIALMARKDWREGLILFAVGYLFQYAGHAVFEKNELGEIILIRSIVRKFRGNKNA